MAERRWDAFLTEADRDHLARSGLAKVEPFGLGRAPALLLVDVFRAALGERGVADSRRWPMSCGDAGWAAVDRTVPLLAAARRAGVPVVHVTASSSPTWWGTAGPRSTGAMADGDPWEIVEPVAPRDGELVISKVAPSAFAGTPLAFHLNAWRVDTVLVCGEATSGCVRATVVDAATSRFKVGVVEQCCFDRTEASHWINLFDMDQKYADVIDADEAERYLLEAVAR